MIELALVGKGFSGRGVRVRTLDGDERDAALELAAKELGAEATNVQWRNLSTKTCIIKMIVEVTKDSGLKDWDAVRANTSWMKLSEQELYVLQAKKPPLLNAKDLDLLARVYTDNHDASRVEVDAILGKAIEVTTD